MLTNQILEEQFSPLLNKVQLVSGEEQYMITVVPLNHTASASFRTIRLVTNNRVIHVALLRRIRARRPIDPASTISLLRQPKLYASAFHQLRLAVHSICFRWIPLPNWQHRSTR